MTPPTRRWSWRRRAAVALGVLVALWLLASAAAVHRLTGRSRPPFAEPAPPGMEPLRLTTSDGETLGAWFLDGRPGRAAVVLLHGNGSSRSDCLAEADLAASAGHPVLLVTMRAHGDSTGAANDFGWGARHDVLSAVDWLAARRPGKVVVWGRSLGSAAALFAAAELGERVSAYVLECPYRDLWTAVRNRTRHYLPPGVELVAYAGLTATAPLVRPGLGRPAPLDAAAGVPASARVLVLAGTADRRATAAEAAELRERLGPRAELVVVEGGDHLKLAAADPAAYRAAVLGFLALNGGSAAPR